MSESPKEYFINIILLLFLMLKHRDGRLALFFFSCYVVTFCQLQVFALISGNSLHGRLALNFEKNIIFPLSFRKKDNSDGDMESGKESGGFFVGLLRFIPGVVRQRLNRGEPEVGLHVFGTHPECQQSVVNSFI